MRIELFAFSVRSEGVQKTPYSGVFCERQQGYCIMRYWEKLALFGIIKTVFIVTFFFNAVEVYAQPIQLFGTFISSSTNPYGYIKLNTTFIEGHNIYQKNWVTVSNYYEANNNSFYCGLNSGDSSGSAGTTTDSRYLDASIFTGNCTQTGLYYWTILDTTASTTYYIAIQYNGTSSPITLPTEPLNCSNPTTRILDFSPYDGVTLLDNNVNFTLNACINEEDIGDITGVNITLHNIDQNVLLVSDFSPSDIYLLRERNIQQSGLYNFSTTTIIGDGNYRIEACIERSYLFGFIRNPFSDITECQSHQFIVVEGTFIGNVSQNLWGDTNSLFNGMSATSSEVLAHTCNPIGGDFSIQTCLVYLFVPDGNELKKTMENARDGFLTRFPIGYITRFVTIVNSSATTSLPAFSIPVQVGDGTDTIYVSIDTGDMVRGGGELLDSVKDPYYNKSVRDIFEPWVQGSVALMVIMTIIGTELRAHREEEREIKRKGKLS